jgi:hypothetical protein
MYLKPHMFGDKGKTRYRWAYQSLDQSYALKGEVCVLHKVTTPRYSERSVFKFYK